MEFVHDLELDDHIDRLIDRHNINACINSSPPFVIHEGATYTLYADASLEDEDDDDETNQL
jgi:hypothetical protein